MGMSIDTAYNNFLIIYIKAQPYVFNCTFLHEQLFLRLNSILLISLNLFFLSNIATPPLAVFGLSMYIWYSGKCLSNTPIVVALVSVRQMMSNLSFRQFKKKKRFKKKERLD